MKLMVICSRFPYPLDKGDKLRMYYQIRELSRTFDIHLVALSQFDIDDEVKAPVSVHCASIHVIRLSTITSYFNVFKGIISNSRVPAQCAYFKSRAARVKIHDLVAQIKPDRIYFQLLRTALYAAPKDIPQYIDLMDAFSSGAHMRMSQAKLLSKWFWKREFRLLCKMEQEAIEQFDKSFIISDLDRRRLGKPKQLIVVNNGIDAHFFSQQAPLTPEYDIVFVGNLGYYPNKQAVKFLADRIMPTYSNKYGRTLKANIVGPRSGELKALSVPGLHFSGWYENVIDGYRSGQIFVAPLFEGIGQQNKILEAMAIGIPCITTPDVAEALRLEDGRHLIIANNEDEFADAIQSLGKNPQVIDKMTAEARDYVRSNFTWEDVCRPLIEAIK